jgi:RNA polymerase sigma factor (TIGR02999 family)
MKTPGPSQITEILESINSGDRGGIDQLFPLVYDTLRKMARKRMAQESRSTLQTTALVHEVYLRLLQDQQPHWENRRHFFAIAAEAMRRILVENARRRSSLKRGGNRKPVVFSENMVGVDSDPELLITFDQALTRLQTQDKNMSDVVKFRCFAGLTVKETALAMGISPRNVDRYWAAARAWLYRAVVNAPSKAL